MDAVLSMDQQPLDPTTAHTAHTAQLSINRDATTVDVAQTAFHFASAISLGFMF